MRSRRRAGLHVGCRTLAIAAGLILVGGAPVAHADGDFGPPVSKVTLPARPGPLAATKDLDAPPDGPPAHGTRTVPMWSGTYQAEGSDWPITMVGTFPGAGSATTTVPAEIIPLRMEFASDGSVLADPSMAADVAASPVFRPLAAGPGTGQWADIYQRASFWPSVSTTSPDYHVSLGGPAILPEQTLHVPADKGQTTYDASIDRRFGLVDQLWFQQRIKELLGSLQIDPATLPVFLTDNVDTVEAGHDIRTCLQTHACVGAGGFHGAVLGPDPVAGGRVNPALSAGNGQALQTYVYADAEDLGDFVPPPFDIRALGLSHEVMEWMDDPVVLVKQNPSGMTGGVLFGSAAPRWTSPFFAPFCSDLVEVADPVGGLGGPLAGVADATGRVYLLSDAAFLSWFARETPSTAYHNLYDILHVLGGPSDPC